MGTGRHHVYFIDTFGERHRFRLYRSQYRDGTYQPAESLPFSEGTYGDVGPAVAPDESLLILGSGRPPAKSMDLFIVWRLGVERGSCGRASLRSERHLAFIL